MTDLYDTSPESCGIKKRKGQEPAISLRYPSRARAVSYSPFVVFLVLKHKRFHKGVNYGDNFCRRHCRRISFIWTAARARGGGGAAVEQGVKATKVLLK